MLKCFKFNVQNLRPDGLIAMGVLDVRGWGSHDRLRHVPWYNISNIQVVSRDLDFYKFNIDLEIKDISHLNQIIIAMRLSQFVESVERSKD